MATQRKRTGENNNVWKPAGGRGGRAGAATNRTGKPKPKAAKPASKTKVADYTDAQGNVYDGNTGRLKSASKTKVADYTDAQGNVYDGNKGHLKKAASKPSGSSSEPPAPKPKPPAPKPADKVPSGSSKATSKQDKNYRGNLFERTFGYKKGEAPDQLNKRANYAGADTGYTPSTKVDKNYADKKPVNQTPVSYGKDTKLANEPAKPASPPSPNQPKKYDKASKGMTLAERMRRRRLGLD